MWKCPQCETVNKDEKCVICGEFNPYFPKVNLDAHSGQGGGKLRSTMRNQKNSGNKNGVQYGRQNQGGNKGRNLNGNGQHTAPTIDLASREANNYVRQNDSLVIGNEVQGGNNVQTGNSVQAGNNVQTGKGNAGIKESGENIIGNPYVAPVSNAVPYEVEYYGYDDAVTMPDGRVEKKKMNRAVKWLISILIIVIVCGGSCIGFLEIQRSRAKSAYDSGDYDKAKSIYSSIGFYRDSEANAKKSEYAGASKLLESGKLDEARKLFQNLESYSDSDRKLLKCDYELAMEAIKQENLIEAYEKLVNLEKNDYEDSRSQMNSVVEKIYEKGVKEYREGNYEKAKTYFEKYEEGCKKAGKSANLEYKSYLTLISARDGGVEDVSVLYKLIDFEDTKDILLSNTYVLAFLEGKWKDKDGRRLEYYKEGNGIKNYSNLPVDAKGNYRISNGIQEHGSKEDGWKKGFKFTIVNENKMNVYCYKDGKTYIMFRQ